MGNLVAKLHNKLPKSFERKKSSSDEKKLKEKSPRTKSSPTSEPDSKEKNSPDREDQEREHRSGPSSYSQSKHHRRHRSACRYVRAVDLTGSRCSSRVILSTEPPCPYCARYGRSRSRQRTGMTSVPSSRAKPSASRVSTSSQPADGVRGMVVYRNGRNEKVKMLDNKEPS